MIDYLIDVCRMIRDDPFVDGQHKFPYPLPPLVYRIWTDGSYWVLYNYRADIDTVFVHDIGAETSD